MVTACNCVKQGLKKQILRNYASHFFRGNTFLSVVNGLYFKWPLSLLVGFHLFVIKHIQVNVFLSKFTWFFLIDVKLFTMIIVDVTTAKAFNFNLKTGAKGETRDVMCVIILYTNCNFRIMLLKFKPIFLNLHFKYWHTSLIQLLWRHSFGT